MAKKFGNGIDLLNQRGINFATPSTSTDAANKAYVDSVAAGLQWKQSVRVASTTNVNIASPGTQIDGVTLASGNRVLLKNQTDAKQNGIYTWTASNAAMTRTADAVQGTLVKSSAYSVEEGTINADKAWIVSNDGTITVGTDNINFARFGGTQDPYVSGSGIDVTGLTISVKAGLGVEFDGSGNLRIDQDLVVVRYAATIGDGTNTSFTLTHGLGHRDWTYSIRDTTTQEFIDADVTAPLTTTANIVFGTAPTSNQFRVTILG